MNQKLWIITWAHRRGESPMEDTLASTRREAWRKCFKWYTDDHPVGSASRHEFAVLYNERRRDGTHRAVKVTLAEVAK